MHKENYWKRFFCIFISGLLIIAPACNPSNFELPSYQADFILPLIDVELSVQDLMLADTTEIIRKDSTNLVVLGYEVSERITLDDIPIDDQKEKFTIPGIPGTLSDIFLDVAITPQIIGINTGLYNPFPPSNYTKEVESSVEEFVQANFVSGSLGITLTNNFPLTISQGIKIQLINQGDTNPVFELLYNQNIAEGETVVFADADLSGKSITGDFIFKVENLGTPGAENVLIVPENSFDFEISFTNIKLGSATFKNPQLSADPIEFDIQFIFPSGALLTQMRIDFAKVSIDIPGLSNNTLIRLTFLSGTQNGLPISIELGNEKLEMEFTDLIFDLSQSTPSYNILQMRLESLFIDSSENIEINFDTPLEGTISLTEMDYDYQKGYLGKFKESVMGNLEIDFFDRIMSGSIEFDDPRLSISLSNGVGVGGKFEDDGKGLYIKGANNRLFPNHTVSIGNALNGFVIPPAISPGNPQSSQLILNKTNEPDFGRFMSLFPTYIEYRLPITGGTDIIDLNQFVDDDDIIEVNIGVELPLNLSANNLIISDTIAFAFEFNAEKFVAQSVTINSRLENFFPIALVFQTYFLDNSLNVIDSLFKEITIIDAAILEDGSVIEPIITKTIVEIEKGQLANLKKTAFAIPVLRLATQNQQFVKLLSNYKLNLKMTVEIVTDVNLNQ